MSRPDLLRYSGRVARRNDFKVISRPEAWVRIYSFICLCHLLTFKTELTSADIAAIDAAGTSGARRLTVRTFVKRTVVVALVGAAALGICGYFGIDII